MASFEIAIRKVLEHEGFSYTDNPVDPGGPTKYGITLATLRRVRPGSEKRDVIALTLEAAEEVYRKLYWDACRLGQVADQLVATKVMDIAVNLGVAGGVRLLQRSLKLLEFPIEEDGVMGPVTLRYTNETHPHDLLLELCAEQDHYYRALVAKKPILACFARGWSSRAAWPFTQVPEAA